MNTTITTRRTVTAFAGTVAAIAIAFGTAACGDEVAKDSTPAAPGAIGQVAPFHGSATQVENKKSPNGEEGRPFTPPDSRIPD
jgi:putative methionine-R-sulfoxide reductase with GAF domain